MVYLFIGQDPLSKDAKLKQLKDDTLPSKIADFNRDILYAKELSLKSLQEKLLYFPLKAEKRVVVIKDAQALKEDLKDYLIRQAKIHEPRLLLVLDIDSYNPKDEFIKNIGHYAKIFRFKETPVINTFSLARQIALKKTDYALLMLKQLLEKGEKPEWILGGLRHTLERNSIRSAEIKKHLKLLLTCDINIKTGRLKAPFALEWLVVNLCGLKKP